MAIDIRAIANCSIGTLISGDIRDDYVQGTGLIKCSGSVELSGVVRPAVGTAVEFSYTRGGTTTYVPRKLRVLSSFADPFRRVTRVELGCKLTYLAQKKPAINWDAFDDPENAGLTEEDAEIITIPIYAASVMNECLSELGISASQNPLTNKFSIETFDFSSGYVEVLSGLLVSESFVGYLDRNEVLQVLPLDQESASGPVIGKAGIIEIRSIGVGDLPGEAVTVSYSSLKLKSPEGTEIDPNNQPVVSSDVNTSSTTSSIIVSYTSPTDGEPRTRVYNILQTTETITKYDQRKKYEEVDGELKETKEKVSVVKERKTTEKITKAAIIGSWISQVLSKGVSVASTQPGLPAVTVTTETYLYNMKCEEIRREMVKMGTESHAVGQVGLPMVFDMPDGSVQVINISDYGLYLLDRNVVETTRSGRNYTKIVTSTYGPWIKTISGQQTIAESRDSFTSRNQVEQYLAQARNGNFLISQTIDTSRAYYSGQAAPSFAEQNNERYADTSGDPSNGYRVESSQDLELAVGSATAQTRIELSLPYAPDDVFIKDGDIYRTTKSDAAIKARNYGRVQNRLLLANRSGMSIQTAAGILPAAPFAAFVVSANGINGVYRTNGMGWTFGPDGVVVSTDALFWGAAGAEPAATGVPWFPVAPGITTLPPSPAVVNGTMTVANVVPVWNETVVIRSRVRIRVTVESLAYALTLPAVVVSKRVRVRGSGRRVVSIELPVTTLTMSGGVPLVHVPAIVNVPVTTLPLSAAVPSVEEAGVNLNLPVTALTIEAAEPIVTASVNIVELPATTLALSVPAPVVTGADPDALAYITAVEAADGQALESGVRGAIDQFVKGCKADGTWSAIKAACILAGARTLTGALVPLVGTAPTNNGFVSGDYNRKTGLVGNGSSKYLNSNRAANSDPQNNNHTAVYQSTHQTRNVSRWACGAYTDPASRGLATTSAIRYGLTSDNFALAVTESTTPAGFWGASRVASNTATMRYGGTSITASGNSAAIASGTMMVFARSGSPATGTTATDYSDARIAFYSIGEAVDMALLDSRLTTMMAAIAAAIP